MTGEGLSMVDDTSNPPARPVRVNQLPTGPVLPPERHDYMRIAQTAGWMGLIILVVGLSFTLGWLTCLQVTS